MQSRDLPLSLQAALSEIALLKPALAAAEHLADAATKRAYAAETRAELLREQACARLTDFDESSVRVIMGRLVCVLQMDRQMGRTLRLTASRHALSALPLADRNRFACALLCLRLSKIS